MANPFDQFDEVSAASTGNPFDQFDSSPVDAAPKSNFQNNFEPTLNPAPQENTLGLNSLERFAKGIPRAAAKRVLGIGQLANQTMPPVAKFFGVPAQEDLAGAIQQANKEGKGTGFAGGLGEVVGDPVNYIPMGAPLKAGKLGIGALAKIGAKQGAISGVTEGSENANQTLTDRGKSTLGSAAAGSILAPAIGKPIQALVSPNVSAQAKKLMDEGVSLTPGSILGGMAKRVEDASTSLPVWGDVVRHGQTKSLESLNKTAWQRALSPIGEKLPEDLHGREAMNHVADTLDDHYDTLLGNMHGQADHQFINDLQLAKSNAFSDLTDTEYKTFDKMLEEQIKGKMLPNGTYPGDVLKGIESKLGKEAKGYSSSPDWDKRKLGESLFALKDSMRDMVSRTSPQNAAELAKINKAYANFTRLRKATSSLGAEEGMFTPKQLKNAVRAEDKSVGKGKFAKGQALMQDLADPASSVLPSKVPDSGTALRAVTMGGLLKGASLSPASLALLPLSPFYSKPGMKAAEYALARRPPGADKAASLLQRLGAKAAATEAPELTKKNGGRIIDGFKLKPKKK